MASTIRKRARRDDDESTGGSHGGRDYDRRGSARRSRSPDRSDSSKNNLSRYGPRDGPIEYVEAPFDRSRELFVGNLVAEHFTEQMLMKHLNVAMKEALLVPVGDPDPIINCRLAGKYGFIEFRDHELATKGLSLNAIPFLDHPLKINRPAKFQGGGAGSSDINNLTWTDLIQQVEVQRKHSIGFHPLLGNMETKIYRELFIGNCTESMSESALHEFLGTVLYKLGMSNSGLESPILGVKSSGKYMFVVCRTPEEAANLINLSRIPFKNAHLKIQRPAKFDGEVAGVTYFDFHELMSMYDSGELQLITSGNPTRILRITNMCLVGDLRGAGSVYTEMLEDVRAMCGQYGTVKNVLIPREGEQYESAKVFVEMSSIEEARSVIRAIKGRVYNSRWIDVRFFAEDKYRMQQYSFEVPCVVVTSSFGGVGREQVLCEAAIRTLKEYGEG